MHPYKHTQIGYVMLVVTIAVLALFVWVYMAASAEPASIDSGPNFLITTFMALVVIILASFITLTVSIDEKYLQIKFGYGIFRKRFALSDITSVQQVNNKWYYGWGIRFWMWPKMWIYNISGFDAVEIQLRNSNIYRIGTDAPQELLAAITRALKI